MAENDNLRYTKLALNNGSGAIPAQDPASIDQAIEAGVERFGKIAVLINNAGFGLFGLFEATPREKIREQFDVNVFGVMAFMKSQFLPKAD
jgi:NAD(P)-dependent dehydrogenase (short-subunit alcohol dehydrogenase family)